jgi:hypothetical protein
MRGSRDSDRARGVRRRRGSRRALAVLVVVGVGVALVGSVSAGARVQSDKQAAVKRAAGAKVGQAGKRLRALGLERVRVRAIDLSCLASFQFDFSPALDNNTVSSQTTAALTGCVSNGNRYRDLLSAILFADRGHSTATGCAPLPIVIDGVGSILWNDESTSEFTFRVNTNPLSGKFGLEAEITGGTLAGGRISALPALILQDGLCGLGGVRSLAVNFGMDIFTH